MSTVGKVLLGIVCVIAMIFAINQFEIFGIKFWGTQRENARREVFENSQSYVEGKRQELVKAHHEWVNADAEGKLGIEYTIRQSFANFDRSKIEDPQMYSFLNEVMNK